MADRKSIETLCIHGDNHSYNEDSRAISFPIYQTASFSHIETGHNGSGFDYTRESNPTRSHLEETLAAVEGAEDCVAFSSGMAAITACFELFKPNDHIIIAEDLYGGVVRLIHNIEEKNGLVFEFVDTTDVEKIKAAVRKETKAIYLETPSNPMMNVTDISACAEIAKAAGAYLIVDNTFMSPYFQNPIKLGADIVVHSGSKFISGHNDTICGFVCTATSELADRIRLIAKTVGNTLAPFDSWLAMRGLKTLAVRMERQQENAVAIVEWLKKQDKVNKIYYIGCEDHPGYEINKKQSRGSGSMISFSVDTPETALALLKGVKVVTFAESLGGTESLITYPIIQTHPDVPDDVKKHLGITDTLIRLSVGLENVNDIIEDLDKALNSYENTRC